MKKNLLLILPVLAASVLIINSCKKNSTETVTPTPTQTTPATPPSAAVTNVGQPVGSPTIANVDASGGTVTSPDGILEIIIPAGALSVSTQIKIQPVTNYCVGGMGLAYNVSPKDSTFNSAVTIRFHYGSADLTGTDQLALSIAFQEMDSTWQGRKSVIIDTIAKTLSYNVTKFAGRPASHHANGKNKSNIDEQTISWIECWRLNPLRGSVKVGGDKMIEVQINRSITDTPEDYVIFEWIRWGGMPPLSNWQINGHDVSSGPDGSLAVTGGGSVNYHAPATIPAINPVRISLKMNMLEYNFTMFSYIKVETNPYFVSVIFQGTGISFSPVFTFDYSDHANFSFNIEADNSVTVDPIENFDGVLSNIQPVVPGCTINSLDAGNLLQVDSVGVFPSLGTIQIIVYSTTINFAWQEDCGSGPITFPQSSSNVYYLMPSFPMDGDQHTVTNQDYPGRLITVYAYPQ